MSSTSKRLRNSARSEEQYYKQLGFMPLVAYNFGGKYVVERAPWLSNYAKRGRCNTYLPCVLVEYLKLAFGTEPCNLFTVPENMSLEIAAFLCMSPQTQREHIDGLILARDLNKEDKPVIDWGTDELPF